MSRYTRQSRFLCWVLRHQPDAVGLTLDAHGWVAIATLAQKVTEQGRQLTEEIVREIAATDEKQRYSISDDGTLIRANYGHSVPVELDATEHAPPERLFHGTATRSLGSIMAHGIRSEGRRYVHLSEDEATAVSVGRRHGKPVVLEIDAAGLAAAGYRLFCSPGGTWLVEEVPATCIIRVLPARSDPAGHSEAK
jgi:putative RNA 2'-phosphotransferase